MSYFQLAQKHGILIQNWWVGGRGYQIDKLERKHIYGEEEREREGVESNQLSLL